MALEVCEIRHGGISDKYYTLTDFSTDVGINRKTLSSWVHTYRDVLLKSDIKRPSEKDWSNALAVSRILKTEREMVNKDNGTPGGRGAFKKDISKERVKDIFIKVSTGKAKELVSLENIYSSSRQLKKAITSLDMSMCDRSKLIHIMENIDIASDVINDYLSGVSGS